MLYYQNLASRLLLDGLEPAALVLFGANPVSLLAELAPAQHSESFLVEPHLPFPLLLVDRAYPLRLSQGLLPHPAVDAGLLEVQRALLLAELLIALVVHLPQEGREAFDPLAFLLDLAPTVLILLELLLDLLQTVSLVLAGTVQPRGTVDEALVDGVAVLGLALGDDVGQQVLSLLLLGLENLVFGEEVSGGAHSRDVGQSGQFVG